MLMVRIESLAEHKLGVPAMDADHEALLGLCNDYVDAAHAGAPVGQLVEAIDRVIEQTRRHFEAEEKLLDRNNYPGLAAHKAEHARLLVQVQTLSARFSDPIAEDALRQPTMEAAQFLQTWLLDHIRTDDKPYRPFLMSLA